MSRRRYPKKKVKRNKFGYTVEFVQGLNYKNILVSDDVIAKKEIKEYPLLNDLFAAVISQLLYEEIEGKPYELKLSRQNELRLKKFKFYLSKAYYSTWTMIKDYINCNIPQIELQFKRAGFNSLDELEDVIKGL